MDRCLYVLEKITLRQRAFRRSLLRVRSSWLSLLQTLSWSFLFDTFSSSTSSSSSTILFFKAATLAGSIAAASTKMRTSADFVSACAALLFVFACNERWRHKTHHTCSAYLPRKGLAYSEPQAHFSVNWYTFNACQWYVAHSRPRCLLWNVLQVQTIAAVYTLPLCHAVVAVSIYI